jgi:hypothetical protein
MQLTPDLPGNALDRVQLLSYNYYLAGTMEQWNKGKYQIPNTKSRGCQVSEMIDLNTETRTLKPQYLRFVIWNF